MQFAWVGNRATVIIRKVNTHLPLIFLYLSYCEHAAQASGVTCLRCVLAGGSGVEDVGVGCVGPPGAPAGELGVLRCRCRRPCRSGCRRRCGLPRWRAGSGWANRPGSVCTMVPFSGSTWRISPWTVPRNSWPPAAAGGEARKPPSFSRSPWSFRFHFTLPVAGSEQTTSLPMQLKLAFWKLRMREPWKACIVETLAWPTFSAAALGLAAAGAPPPKPFI